VISQPTRAEDFRLYRWERPDWWLTLVVSAAWVILVAEAVGGAIATQRGGLVSGLMAVCVIPVAVSSNLLASVGDWALMVAAVMLPLAASDARWLAHRSFAARRQRSVVLHVAAFFAAWLTVGVIAIITTQALGGGAFLAAAALGAAGLWHVTPMRRRALRRCGAGRLPAVRGIRADLDCLRAGTRSARDSLLTCGLAMLSMAVIHSFAIMALLTILGLNERRQGPNPERRVARPREALGLIAVACVVAIPDSVIGAIPK